MFRSAQGRTTDPWQLPVPARAVVDGAAQHGAPRFYTTGSIPAVSGQSAAWRHSRGGRWAGRPGGGRRRVQAPSGPRRPDPCCPRAWWAAPAAGSREGAPRCRRTPRIGVAPPGTAGGPRPFWRMTSSWARVSSFRCGRRSSARPGGGTRARDMRGRRAAGPAGRPAPCGRTGAARRAEDCADRPTAAHGQRELKALARSWMSASRRPTDPEGLTVMVHLEPRPAAAPSPVAARPSLD